ncbi:MAG: hypothetical protein G01um101466_159 [Parcubacteria group bacterium Gr01-1014_66]|nr:MAG: hypothetical protein G01um101466_159 [Parcubacteria group bacterium Gr01-1014_66]
MLSWRGRRQVVLSAIIFFILSMGALGIWYYVRPLPSCQDTHQNQGEEGVDCGGPCTPCAIKRAKPVAIFSTRAFLVRDGLYDTVAEIQNQNSNLSARSVEYIFTFSDSFGIIGERTGNAFLLPNERILVVEPGIALARVPSPLGISFRVVRAEWIERTDAQIPVASEQANYRIVETPEGTQSSVEASVGNKSVFDVRNVQVVVGVFDEQGNILGINKVVVDEIPGGGKTTINATWPGIIAQSPAQIRVDARINPFEKGGVIPLR